MIKKLRMKLIFASMFSLFAVLLIIMGTITLLNYREVVADADGILSILADNNGTFPDASNRSTDGLFRGDPPDLRRQISPELPYESRYFSVSLDGDGRVLSVNTGKIAAVDTSAAIDYAKKVEKNGRMQGFIGNFRFIVHTSGLEKSIIFLDCGRSLHTFQTFVLTSACVSTAGLLAVFLLMIFLSGRIVRPFTENFEKQKRFITDAGHELKTPLTIIDADAEVLEMDFGSSEWIDDIRQQTKRLTDLTGSLIMLSRMEEDQARLQKIDFPVSEIAEEAVGAFQSLVKTQNKRFTCSIEPMLSMHGDAKAIRQLFFILLDNALKYSPQGGFIAFLLEKQKNQIRLTVSNTTEWIDREHVAHLFDRFYRTDQSRNSKTGGYGLGLSIAAAIVNAHKGKINASAPDEKSLSITVSIPL